MGTLAVALSERLQANEYQAKIPVMVNFYLRPWKVHVRECAPEFRTAYQQGLEVGDLEWAAYAEFCYTAMLYICGEDLVEVQKNMAVSLEALEQLRQETPYGWTKKFHQTVSILLSNQEKPEQLRQEAIESVTTPNNSSETTTDGLTSWYTYFDQMLLCYLLRAYPQAQQMSSLASSYLNHTPGSFLIPVYYFYDSLIQLATLPTASKHEQKRQHRRIKTNQKKMHKWAKHAPMNYLHRFHLIEAERTRLAGKESLAREHYDMAIRLARDNQYLNDEAVAYELAGQFYMERGDSHLALHYLRDAHNAYQRWGAKVKVRDLEIRYPQIAISIENA
ncbi:hypothetical protein KFU94_65620 [Chloroflexi bacterium TSY]|nr:hypothetical protein [Chloroflexi bacterium TSY]